MLAEAKSTALPLAWTMAMIRPRFALIAPVDHLMVHITSIRRGSQWTNRGIGEFRPELGLTTIGQTRAARSLVTQIHRAHEVVSFSSIGAFAPPSPSTYHFSFASPTEAIFI